MSRRGHLSRIAVLDGGVLCDLFIDNAVAPTYTGAVYKGRILRVLPGMQAAFVDIGLDKAAFLFVGDTTVEAHTHGDDFETTAFGNQNHQGQLAIQEVLRAGQEVLIQVSKDPLGTKGARVTMQLSLPGRYLVLVPGVLHQGVSRKISNLEERQRLLSFLESLSSEHGVIARTAAEGVDTKLLLDDYKHLVQIWERISKVAKSKSAPALIHSEIGVELQVLRDYLATGVEHIWVDHEKMCERVRTFLLERAPQYIDRLKLHKEGVSLFEKRGLEAEIHRALGRKIWLKSGGYIIIDETEACVVIDVNTGKYVGRQDLQETILKINLEAVREIASQLRIRNCGGIIILDLIDMASVSHRNKVLSILEDELKKDKARTNIVSMSSLGLVEMTRKRTRPSLRQILCEGCDYCNGSGYVKKVATVGQEILLALERSWGTGGARGPGGVVCHPHVLRQILEEDSIQVAELEKILGYQLTFRADETLHREEFEILWRD